jgi:hypothetical protein
MTQPTMPASSANRTTETGSPPVAIAQATVSTAPTPTHTARVARPRPGAGERVAERGDDPVGLVEVREGEHASDDPWWAGQYQESIAVERPREVLQDAYRADVEERRAGEVDHKPSGIVERQLGEARSEFHPGREVDVTAAPQHRRTTVGRGGEGGLHESRPPGFRSDVRG